MHRQFKITFQIPVTVTKKKKWWVSRSPDLQVSSQGATKAKALESLKEALELFFETCAERNTFFEVMQECGVKLMPEKIGKPIHMPHNYLPINIPIPAMFTHSPTHACHV